MTYSIISRTHKHTGHIHNKGMLEHSKMFKNATYPMYNPISYSSGGMVSFPSDTQKDLDLNPNLTYIFHMIQNL